MTYTKFHESWSATDELTGAAFNHIETQWTLAKIDIDAHNHDTRYYTKTLADTTFFSTSFYTGFDADKVDGQHLSDLVAAVMPIGAIMIWSGTDANVPTGWHIADGGTYSGTVTPNLRDRFVIGAGDTYAVNATSGPANWNGTISPTGTVTVGDHTLTTAELPTHTHGFTEYYSPLAGYSDSASQPTNRVIVSTPRSIGNQADGDGSHGHTGSTASFTGIDPRSTYYSLYYICKVS